MNIVLGALLLALLLLPGILFRLAYLALPLSNRSLKSSFLEELVFSLIPAFAFQVGGYALVEKFGPGLNEQKLVLLLRYSVFRIYNEWEIYFDGHILDIPDQKATHRQAQIVERGVDVMVQTTEGCFLYVGLLEKYVISKDEKLDRIYLSSVRRRKLADDVDATAYLDADAISAADDTPEEIVVGNPEELKREVEASKDSAHYYHMPGHYFMIPGSEIKNIHITYYFEPDDSAT